MREENNQPDYPGLIFKYLKGGLSADEKQQLDDWLAADERNRELLAGFNNRELLAGDMEFFDTVDLKADWEAVATRTGYEIYETARKPAIRRRIIIIRWSIAASILLALGLAWEWPSRQKGKGHIQQDAATLAIHDVPPGGNRAVLQLASGQTVRLGKEGADTTLEENGAQIRQQQGQLVYNGSGPIPGQKMQYNTLSTPRGGQYELILADGTAVWLNASSSLRFPTQFTENDRTVELTGEGYFEVAKDKNKPFYVKVNGMEVAVLGTHFNIMAYKGVTKTTLAEGSVRIQLPDKRTWKLTPGQQAVVKENNNVQIAGTDIEKALAWKNGVFYFKDDTMADIMEQLARWYDVDIQVKGMLPLKRISGNIRRQAQLSQVLDMLNFVSGAKFVVEGRKVTVSF